jgi:hypothetical protein
MPGPKNEINDEGVEYTYNVTFNPTSRSIHPIGELMHMYPTVLVIKHPSVRGTRWSVMLQLADRRGVWCRASFDSINTKLRMAATVANGFTVRRPAVFKAHGE